MNTVTSLAMLRTAGSTKPVPDNFIKIRNTSPTAVENSGMIDGTFKSIVSIVEETATRPKRIDARCNMSGETYIQTVGRIETGLLAH